MKKSDHGVEVIKVDNGFTIRDSAGNITIVEETDNDELRVGEKLLWTLIEFFNLGGNEFGRECIAVIRTVGDEYTLQKDEEMIAEHYQKVVEKKTRKTKRKKG